MPLMPAGQAGRHPLSPFAGSDVDPLAARRLSRQRNALPKGLALIGEHCFHAGSSEGAELDEPAPSATRRAGGGLGRGNSLPSCPRNKSSLHDLPPVTVHFTAECVARADLFPLKEVTTFDVSFQGDPKSQVLRKNRFNDPPPLVQVIDA